MAAAYMAGQEDAFGFVWPLDCTRVTDDMTAGESMKLQTSMTNHILQELKGTDHKAHESDNKHSIDKYGGESTVYRVSTLGTLSFISNCWSTANGT